MILYRCFACNERAKPTDPDGALFIPRALQGEGRHDNPDAYGCLYLSETNLSPVVEQLARFRGQALTKSLLRRRGLPLAVAEIDLAESASLVDLDDPEVLERERLRPSQVATRERGRTQPQALGLYERHATAVGVRWWSSFESLWLNVTLFDRARRDLRVRSVDLLSVSHPLIISAADFLGLDR